MIDKFHASIQTRVAAIGREGFTLALAIGVAHHMNGNLDKPADQAIFLHKTRGWNHSACASYRMNEPTFRAYIMRALPSDAKEAKRSTAYRAVSMGMTLARKAANMIGTACAAPAGQNEADTPAKIMERLALALAGEGVRNEADMRRYLESGTTDKAEKTPLEKASAALTLMLKHGAGNATFFTLAISACEAARDGNMERAAELLAAASEAAPQAAAEDDGNLSPLGEGYVEREAA